MEESDTWTADDIADANRASVARSAATTRIGGAVLVGIGAVGALAWAWAEVRTQQRVDSPVLFSSASGGDGLDLADRIDLLTASLSTLLLAGLVIGLGLALRVVADYVQIRTGSSITGFNVGDPVPELELEATEE